MNTELAEAKAALSRIAAGTNHAGDIRAVRVAIERLDALSTPPADDVREALTDESDFTPSTEQVRSHYVFDQSNVWRPERGRAFDRWLAAEVRPRGTVTPTVDEWSEQMDAERARQIEHGYDDAHDVKHGAAHLLNWAIDYARRGDDLAAATMARCALRLPRGTVTDTAPTEYTIAAESSNGAVTQLADYTTVVRDHLKADLDLFRQEEERLEGDPDRIFIAERPIPKWVRS